MTNSDDGSIRVLHAYEWADPGDEPADRHGAEGHHARLVIQIDDPVISRILDPSLDEVYPDDLGVAFTTVIRQSIENFRAARAADRG